MNTTWNKASGKPAGTLYGIGVGPGDPELLTLKAVRVLSQVDVIFAASSIKNDYSLAIDIARPHLSPSVEIKLLSFQMSHKAEEKELLWRQNADRIMAELEAGRNAAFLTLGDALTYSTFGYLARIITAEKPHIKVRSVPGIPSFLAAAARLNLPLVEGDESLLITSGVNGGASVRRFGRDIDNIVMLKVYRHIADINRSLAEVDLIDNSRGISRCGREDEAITEDVREFENRKPDYWTLIIAKRKP